MTASVWTQTAAAPLPQAIAAGTWKLVSSLRMVAFHFLSVCVRLSNCSSFCRIDCGKLSWSAWNILFTALSSSLRKGAPCVRSAMVHSLDLPACAISSASISSSAALAAAMACWVGPSFTRLFCWISASSSLALGLLSL